MYTFTHLYQNEEQAKNNDLKFEEEVILRSNSLQDGLEYILNKRKNEPTLQEWCQDFKENYTISKILDLAKRYPEGFNIPPKNIEPWRSQIDFFYSPNSCL